MNATFMGRITLSLATMTTRKAVGARALASLAAIVGLAFGFAGCATHGELHVYSLDDTERLMVRDFGADSARDVPSFLEQNDQLTGFAYDPFTDHFFLRLAPGNHIRVVDRPARAIKREFDVEHASTSGGGDMAVRPVDGHLFLIQPGDPAVLEVSRLGKFIRTIQPANRTIAGVGIACDPTRDELMILDGDTRTVSVCSARDGVARGEIILDHSVLGSLGFDPEKRQLYGPLAGERDAIGVFDEHGRLLQRVKLPGLFVDVGPRSFLRMF
jgi:hypothetical protein